MWISEEWEKLAGILKVLVYDLLPGYNWSYLESNPECSCHSWPRASGEWKEVRISIGTRFSTPKEASSEQKLFPLLGILVSIIQIQQKLRIHAFVVIQI